MAIRPPRGEPERHTRGKETLMSDDPSNGTKNGRQPSGPRCAALVGPYLSGKTTLLESLLLVTGAIQRRPRGGEVLLVLVAEPGD